jgi:hypothetical protein
MTWLILVGRVGFRAFFFGASHKGVLQITVNGFRVEQQPIYNLYG